VDAVFTEVLRWVAALEVVAVVVLKAVLLLEMQPLHRDPHEVLNEMDLLARLF
jgi:hypothetical protein